MIVLVNKGQEEFEDTKRVTRIRKSKDRQQMPKSCVHKKGTFSGSLRYPLHIYMFDCI
jgi:predicted nucleic acid binding AN1-type Zn finger protein